MKNVFVQGLAILGTVLGVTAVCVVLNGRSLRADDDDHEGTEAKVRIGFEIAPVLLNLKGKNPDLVGLGSYIVNAQADCNGCHTSDPAHEYTQTGNPYLLKPPFSGKTKVDPTTYLGGGNDFGSLVPGSYDIVTRNLTPDKTGMPEGGHTLDEFMQIMPWPTFKNMSDRDLHAIYEYLSAIPCIEGPAAPSILHNDCK